MGLVNPVTNAALFCFVLSWKGLGIFFFNLDWSHVCYQEKKKTKQKFKKKKQVYFGFSFFSYPIRSLIGVDLIWFKFWVWSVPFQSCPIYFIIVG